MALINEQNSFFECQTDDNTDTKDNKKSGAISFSLLLCDLNQQITCKVNPDDNLWTLKRKLVSSTNAKKFADGLNYGFYCPANSGRIGKYLGETRAIKEFSAKDLQDLQFRYKKKYYKNLPTNLKKLKSINDLSHRKTFIQAIYSQKTNDVIKMLKKGHDPNYQDFKTGETPITSAIMSGAPIEILVHLVEEGAHLDYRNTCETTPLHVAAIHGKVEYLKTLLELGASANYRNSDNLTPLHCLSSGTTLDTLISCSQLLLENYSIVDVADDTGNTELHHAAKKGRLLLAKKLIIYGANINRRNSVGNTPLHMAVFNNQETMAKKLLAFGADKWITNRANYDALAAAMTIENNQLVDFIQHFDSSQLSPIKEEPIYHPKRKADHSRRPSLLEFLNHQQKQLQVKSSDNNASRQLSYSSDNGNQNATSLAAGLTTPDAHDVDKIGDYISQIFGTIHEGESIKIKNTKQNNNNNLLAPLFENQRASSYADVRNTGNRKDSYGDDFTDSDEESTTVSPVESRSRVPDANIHKRPATMFINPQHSMNSTESSASLLAYALQNQKRQNSSTLSLSTNSSPLPVVKLRPRTDSQQNTKVASIKSYPKRLTTTETQLLISKNENSRSTIAGEQGHLWSNPSFYPATLNPSSVKHRPSLKEIFPCESMTNLASESTFNIASSRPLPSTPFNESIENVSLFHGNHDLAVNLRQAVLPKIICKDNIYDEIPSLEITRCKSDDGTDSETYFDALSSPVSPVSISATKMNFGSAANISLDYPEEAEEEIYANIGKDGQILSYYHNTSKQTIQNNPSVMTSSIQQTSSNLNKRGISRNSELLAAIKMSDMIEKSSNSDNDQLDSRSQWLKQQVYLQQSQQLQSSREMNADYTDHHHELERALLNQKIKLEKSQPPDKNPHMKLVKMPSNPNQTSLQQQWNEQRQHQQELPQRQEVLGLRTNALQIENQTLPRQKQKVFDQRPMSSFFENSQYSLRSLDQPSHEERFDSLPVASNELEGNVIERSRSVGRLHDNAHEGKSQNPQAFVPFFVPRPESIHSSQIKQGNSARQTNSTNLSNQLNLPQSGLYKASSYQNVFDKIDGRGEILRNNMKSAMNYPRIPPKPPMRTTSIPSSNLQTSSFHLAFPNSPVFNRDSSPENSSGIIPPSVTPEEEYNVVMRSSSKVPQGRAERRSRVSSQNRNSNFESFGITQDQIKQKLDQLRMTSPGDVRNNVSQPVEEIIPLTFVHGKTTSKEFNENKAKLERLFSGGNQIDEGLSPEVDGPAPTGPTHNQDLNARLAVDKTTGQIIYRMDQDVRLEEWSV